MSQFPALMKINWESPAQTIDFNQDRGFSSGYKVWTATGPAMSAVAVSATHLVKWFGLGDARTLAINDVTFEAYFGEMLFMVGPSGSGKTTLLSMISGILKPNDGAVQLKGKDLWALSANELADFRLHTIGFVFQDYHLFPRLSTMENVAIPLLLRGMPWDAAMQEARRYLDVVGLKGRADLPPVKLSGGEQQRVAIARAICSQPDILVLDEPTASLDGDTGRRIISFVRSEVLGPQRCIIIVTHDARIFDCADRVLHLEDGRITGIEKGGAA